MTVHIVTKRCTDCLTRSHLLLHCTTMLESLRSIFNMEHQPAILIVYHLQVLRLLATRILTSHRQRVRVHLISNNVLIGRNLSGRIPRKVTVRHTSICKILLQLCPCMDRTILISINHNTLRLCRTPTYTRPTLDPPRRRVHTQVSLPNKTLVLTLKVVMAMSLTRANQ